MKQHAEQLGDGASRSGQVLSPLKRQREQKGYV
jgi:hypothetical protein